MPQRKGYSTITPYLVCRGASDAIAFYARHFGAVEIYRLPMPDGKLAHAEIKIGDSMLMIADEIPEAGIVSPLSLGGTAVTLNVYVKDADRVFDAILAEGGKALFPVKDQFHGDRSGKLADPFGHVWHIAAAKEDVAPEEVVSRFAAMMGEA